MRAIVSAICARARHALRPLRWSPTGIQGRMTLTGQGLVLGAGTLLAKLDDKTLPIAADQERIWTLLAAAYGRAVSASGPGIASPRGKTLARR